MPNHKSCKKRVKTSGLKRLVNRARRSELRGAMKELRTQTKKEEAGTQYLVVASMLDKAAQDHLIHRKNADRNKARLARFVQGLQ